MLLDAPGEGPAPPPKNRPAPAQSGAPSRPAPSSHDCRRADETAKNAPERTDGARPVGDDDDAPVDPEAAIADAPEAITDDGNFVQWADGDYTISIVAKDASGQQVAIPTEIEGIVDSVDLAKNAPLLSIGGQQFTFDKIKRVVRPGF